MAFLLKNKILTRVQRHINELDGAEYDLRNLKKDPECWDSKFVKMILLCTRMKIHHDCTEVVRLFRKRQEYQEVLKRALKRIRLHEHQLKKYKTEQRNIEYIKLLYALMSFFPISE
jgi:hypothetical protein